MQNSLKKTIVLGICILSMCLMFGGCSSHTDIENIMKEAAIIHQSDREQVMSSYQYYFTEAGLKDFIQLKSISTKDAELSDEQFFWNGNRCVMIARKDNGTGQSYVVVGEVTLRGNKIDSLSISSQLDVG